MKNYSGHIPNVRERGNRTAPRRFDRTYWVLILLFDKLRRIVNSLPAGERLLDYGCGNKPYQALFKERFKLHIGADLEGNREADLILGPEGQVPSEDETFDCVLSSQVLEHVENPHGYLREAYRLLKPGGRLVLSTHGVWQYHPDPSDYWRWTIDGLQREILQAGFEIVMVQGIFGPESSALQLWQDATCGRLPALIQPLYIGFIQFMIGIIERRQPEKLSTDAAVYVVSARKPEFAAALHFDHNRSYSSPLNVA